MGALDGSHGQRRLAPGDLAVMRERAIAERDETISTIETARDRVDRLDRFLGWIDRRMDDDRPTVERRQDIAIGDRAPGGDALGRVHPRRR